SGTSKKKEISRGDIRSEQESESREYGKEHHPTRGRGRGKNASLGMSEGTAETTSESSGMHEVNVPIHEEVEELSGVTFKSFEEERNEWGRDIRILNTGESLAKFYNDRQLHHLLV